MMPNSNAPVPQVGLPLWVGPSARLSLIGPGGGPVRTDGAWWPRSRDLAKELPALLSALDGRWGRITHVTVEAAAWQEGPSAMVLGGHTLRINRSTGNGQRDAVCLLCPGVGRCDLLVVPPEVDGARARRIMSAAAIRH